MNSILVIADTHLGLKSKNINCEPDKLNGFFEWVEFLESQEKGTEVKTKFGPSIKRRIHSPNEILIVGDAIELWDASDQAIYLCSKTIIDRINRLKSEIIYLTGNHDYLIGKNQGIYPLYFSKLQILSDTYPVQDDKSTINTLRKGNCDYLFLHGHQFDKSFRRLGLGAMFMSFLRDGAEALGAYSWIALGFFFLFLIGNFITKTSIFGIVAIIMGIFSLPRGLVSIARPIWNKIFKTRYNREKAINGFFDWWNDFSKNKECKAEMLNVVYGHTHILDFITEKRALSIIRRSLKILKSEVKINLLNIPSWLNDSTEKVPRDIILYIDDYGIEFLKWDAEEKHPFIFPISTILRMSYDIPLNKEEISNIQELTE